MTAARGGAGLYDRTIRGLAVAASVAIGILLVATVCDVSVRTLGYSSPQWTVTLSEYTLLYFTMLAAPHLVRTDGHVRIDAFVRHLPGGARAAVAVAALLASVAVCVLCAGYAAVLTVETYVRGDLDMRSVTLPLWLVYAPLPVGLALTAVELLRLLPEAWRAPPVPDRPPPGGA